ncbi:MAG: lipid-A-disaccharide synthase [Sedimentisphaerales bacterium]|nr:lipid-A-disaccharide synthase [Sedimentisphaerales bacterium]
MIQKDKKYRVFISAAEPSGDDHCANLIRAFQKEDYGNVELVGIGGVKMAEAGCELLQITAGKAAMTYNVFGQLGYYYRLLGRVKDYLRNNKVDLAVVCDSPGFNWHVAKFAKKLGIKTVFFVAPQLWAWASWRIGKMRKSCDKLCCLLPFEEDWFNDRGVDTVFVGNPMLAAIEVEWGRAKDYSKFDAENVRVALMPGSRDAELNSLWEPMQKIALRIKGRYGGASFVTVAVDAERHKMLEDRQIPGFECDYEINSVCRTAGEADFAVVASGSATLEVAAMGCPMVVMYQSSRILWHLVGRWLINTKYLCLVNIVAGRELVPEFMPYFTSIDPIVESIEGFLRDKSKLAQFSGELAELTRPLGLKNTGDEVTRVIAEMLG